VPLNFPIQRKFRYLLGITHQYYHWLRMCPGHFRIVVINFPEDQKQQFDKRLQLFYISIHLHFKITECRYADKSGCVQVWKWAATT